MDIERQIKAWKKLEREAIYAFDAADYSRAADNYRQFLDSAKGKLGPEDPNILWVKRHYSEALMKDGRDAEADEVHHDILTCLDIPETEEERGVFEETLHLRLARARKLLAGRKREEALAVLEEAYEKSLEVLRSKHEISVALRESRDNIRADLLKKQQKDLEKKLRRKYEAERVSQPQSMDRSEDKGAGTEGPQQARWPEDTGFRLSPASEHNRNSFQSQRRPEDRHGRDHLDAAERERLQLLALGAGTPEIRTPSQPRSAAGRDYDTNQNDSALFMSKYTLKSLDDMKVHSYNCRTCKCEAETQLCLGRALGRTLGQQSSTFCQRPS